VTAFGEAIEVPDMRIFAPPGTTDSTGSRSRPPPRWPVAGKAGFVTA